MTEYIDQEWIDIHSWITSIRQETKLSISSFINSCGLDVSTTNISEYCYYRGLVSELGRNSCPSKKDGTSGNIFRNKMIHIKTLGNFETIISDRDKDFAFAIRDWRTDHLFFLRKNSIVDISGHMNILEIRKHGVCIISHDTLLDIIWEDYTISSNFDKNNYSTKSIQVLF